MGNLTAITAMSLIALSAMAHAQQPPQKPVLGPEDKAAYPAAPKGFDQPRDEIAKGSISTVEYSSKSVGTTRKLLIYTPPNYSTEKKYPVLYLLHGIGGTEREWADNGAPQAILDNLIAEGAATPMIVVMPNGRAQADDRAEGNVFQTAPAFGEFDKDLLGSIIPFVDSKYPTLADREHRALAGLSMGGGQSLNFGLANPETFAWVGGFSSAPNTKPNSEILPKPDALKTMKLIWVSCGDTDGLMNISQRVHNLLKEKEIKHVWHVDSGPHNFEVWRNDLYLFAKLLFR